MKLSEFLEETKATKRRSTFKSYRGGISLFVEYYGKDADTILQEHHQDLQGNKRKARIRFIREIEKFHKWLGEEKAYH